MTRVVTTRRGVLKGFGAATALTLSGCAGAEVDSGLPSRSARSLRQPPRELPPATGEALGDGAARVALMLPLSGEGKRAAIATEFRNAAAMALDDAGDGRMQMTVKDTGGTPEGTRDAASEALRERASVVLGPVFAQNVSAAARVLQGSGVPVIAFSSDRSVAGPGVYLNSFLPGGVVDRTLSYAVSQGVATIVAVVPEGQAGDVALAQARETLARTGGTLAGAARYRYKFDSVQQAVNSLADAVRRADAIFIPDGGKTPNAIAAALTGAGIDPTGKTFLGTGQWTSADLSDDTLGGAWFADSDHARIARYKAKYRQRFQSDPSANSALAYDTVVLAANVIGRYGAEGFRSQVIENPSGFSGYAGIFRFNADGTSERGYAVYEVKGGRSVVVSPAPTRFSGTI